LRHSVVPARRPSTTTAGYSTGAAIAAVINLMRLLPRKHSPDCVT